jgi:hypothetical protein
MNKLENVEKGDGGGTMTNANTRQVGGSHYKQAPLEVWDIAAMYELNGFQQSILRYVLRYKSKGGIEDLEKARHYLEKLIEVEKLLLDGKPSMMRALLRDALAKLEAEPTNEAAMAALEAGQGWATERVKQPPLYCADDPPPGFAPGKRVRIERPGTGELDFDLQAQGGRPRTAKGTRKGR